MNSTELDDALRALLEDIGDAAGTPRDFADLPDIAEPDRGRSRWPGALVAAGLVAATVAGLIVLSTQRSGDSSDEVRPSSSPLAWLDMPAAPEGTERVPNDQLASLSVCLDAATVAAAVVCNRMEGRVEVAYGSTSDVGPIYEIQTFFGDLELEGYISGLIDDLGSITRTDLTVRSGRPAVLLDAHNGVVLLVWQERPQVIGQFRSVAAPADTDVPAFVEALIDRPWPDDVSLPIAAVDLGVDWTALDNNHPYVIASHRDDHECLSVGFAPTDAAYAAIACATEALGWTSGVVTTSQPSEFDDVVAGWVPDDAAAVRLTFPDDTVVEIPTHAVPGFARRAWGYLIPSDQGTQFAARLTILSASGGPLSESDIDFINPVVAVDSVCASTNNHGIVPDVVGRPMYDAADAIRAAGLIIAHPLRGDPAQVVTAQDPPPGTDRGCGDVELTLGAVSG